MRGHLNFKLKIWKDFVKPGRPQMTVWRMRIACWLSEATNTVSSCIIRIIAFALKEWFQELASMLRYTCIACLDRIYKPTRERNTNSSVFLIGSIRPSFILSVSEANEDNFQA